MPINTPILQRVLFVLFLLAILVLSVANYNSNQALRLQLEQLTQEQELSQLQLENALLKAEAAAAHEEHIKRLLVAGIARP